MLFSLYLVSVIYQIPCTSFYILCDFRPVKSFVRPMYHLTFFFYVFGNQVWNDHAMRAASQTGAAFIYMY